MRVLLVSATFSPLDGEGRYSLAILKQLVRRGFKITILTANTSGLENFSEIDVHYIPPRFKIYHPLKNLFYAGKLLKFIKRVDFIHFLSDYPYCALISWLPFRWPPFFITAHGTYAVAPLDENWTGKILRKSYRQAMRVFCISRFTQQEILKRAELNNTLVINNGLDFTNFYHPELLNLRDNNKKIIIGVGALKPRKGYHISLQAVAKIKEKYSGFKYYIVGDQKDDKYFTQLKNIVVKLAITDNVVFLEKISDNELLKLYYQANLFLLTSMNISGRFEGFGLVYLEAGACGLPVIGTYGCGAEEAIQENSTGFLVPQNDINKIADAIKKVLDNPDLADELGKQGIINARENDWGVIMKKYLEAYNNSKDETYK